MIQLHIARRNVALVAAGLTAWLLMAASDLLPNLLLRWFFEAYIPPLRLLLGLVFWYAVIGLPIALLVAFLLGGWALNRAILSGRLKLSDAIQAGAGLGLLLGLVSLLFTFAIGARYRLDDNSSINSYAFGHEAVRDGLPTLFGWTLELGGLLATVAIGALSGMVAWSMIKGATQPSRHRQEA